MENEEIQQAIPKQEVNIIGVEVKVKDIKDSDDKEIQKIIFTLDNDERITWKPKSNVENFDNGIKISEVRLCRLSQLPQSVKDLAKKVSQKGKVPAKVVYEIFISDEGTRYKYIRNDDMFDAWEY